MVGHTISQPPESLATGSVGSCDAAELKPSVGLGILDISHNTATVSQRATATVHPNPTATFARVIEQQRPWLLALTVGATTVFDLALMAMVLVSPSWNTEILPNLLISLVWRMAIISVVTIAWVAALIAWRHTRPIALMVVALTLVLVTRVLALPDAEIVWYWRTELLSLSQVVFLCLSIYYIAQFRGPLEALAWFGGALVTQVAVIRLVLASGESFTHWLVPIVGADSLAATIAITLGVRRRLLKDLVERNRLLVIERDQRAALAVADERNRIAGEMHDIVSHSLAVMVTLADGAGRTLPTNPTLARETLTQISATGRQAVADMRRLLAFLRADPELTPQPGLADLDTLLASFREAGVPVVREPTLPTPTMTPSLHHDDRLLPADPSLGLAIYRIVQEGLTNVLRHASGAAWVRVSVARPTTDRVVVRVINGPGGPAESGVGAGAGQGLLGVKQRVAVWDGALSAGATEDGGWELVATLMIGTDL